LGSFQEVTVRKIATGYQQGGRMAARHDAARTIGIACTIAIAVVGTIVVALLWAYPTTSIETASWPVVDRRWITASFALALTLLYAPSCIERLAEAAQGQETTRIWEADQPLSVTRLVLRIALATLVGLALAAIDISQIVELAMSQPIDFSHEGPHLGPIQAIKNGAIPYIEARTQYGLGHQVVMSSFLQHTEFSVRGFRSAFFILNILAEGLRFAIMIIVFAPIAGAFSIALTTHFYDINIAAFTGWGFLFRWFGPFLVGALLPLILWRDMSPRARFPSIAAVGAASGTLAWFSQENFAAGLVAGGIILAAAFARRRLSIAAALSDLALFAGAYVVTFLALITMVVGPEHLTEAVRLQFYIGSLWARGLANTPWGNPESAWTVAFYATPPIVILVSGGALYAPKQTLLSDERKAGIVLGMAAASAALLPITFLRSDLQHFLGPALPVPAMLAGAIAFLPGMYATSSMRRETMRAILLVVVAGLYVFPHGIENVAKRFKVDTSKVAESVRFLSATSPAVGYAEGAPMFQQRLGLALGPQERCCMDGTMSTEEMSLRVEEIRRVAE
jgi:hypothetical protein